MNELALRLRKSGHLPVVAAEQAAQQGHSSEAKDRRERPQRRLITPRRPFVGLFLNGGLGHRGGSPSTIAEPTGLVPGCAWTGTPLIHNFKACQ